MRRDTISVPGEGFTVIRFRADNPGAWVSGFMAHTISITDILIVLSLSH